MGIEIIWNAQETSEDGENDLELNTDIVHNRSKTYNSLSDLYGIQLFTDSRMEENEQSAREQEEKEREIKENIFVSRSKTKEKEQNFIQELFDERMVIVMNQDYEKEIRQERTFFWAGGIMICLLFGILWGNYLKKKKQQKIEEENGYE